MGPKVAACVALFSLDRLDLIPVDTHVHQIALRDYRGELSVEVRRSKGVNKRVHEEIAGLFGRKFGEFAGWAHSVLFTAELPAFRHRLKQEGGRGVEGEREDGEEDVVKGEGVVVVKVEVDEREQEVEKKGTPARKRKAQAGKENVVAELPQELSTTTHSRRRRGAASVVSTTTSSSVSSITSKTGTSGAVKVEVVEVKEVVASNVVQRSTLQFPVSKHRRIPRKVNVALAHHSAPITAL